jgi:hypothetical protein
MLEGLVGWKRKEMKQEIEELGESLNDMHELKVKFSIFIFNRAMVAERSKRAMFTQALDRS